MRIVVAIAYKAEVSNEAQFLIEVYCNTGLYTYFPIGNSATVYKVTATYTGFAINEYVNRTKVGNLVAQIGINLEGTNLCAIVIFITIAKINTYCPFVIEVVTYFRINGEVSLVSVIVAPETEFSTNVNLCTCSDTYQCNECC